MLPPQKTVLDQKNPDLTLNEYANPIKELSSEAIIHPNCSPEDTGLCVSTEEEFSGPPRISFKVTPV